MGSSIFRVVAQDTVSYVPSQKMEGGQLAKCQIRLKKLGSSKFSDEFVASLFGNLALCKFYEGDVVAASLRFQVYETNGNTYQEVIANDIVKLNDK